MLLYIIGENSYFQGTMEYPDDPDEIYGIPYGTTRTPTPEIPEGMYAYWVGNGWELTDAEPPPIVPVKFVPEFITKYQAKMALLEYDLFDQVEEYVKNSDNTALKISWYDATNFYRDNQFISSLAEQFGLTQEQVDDLFILANNY
jgi:hypothetical protein